MTTNPNYAIFRLKKHKTVESAVGQSAHDLRTIPTDSDENRRHKNIFIGPTTPADFQKLITNKLAEVKATQKSNVCLEFVVGSSFGVGEENNKTGDLTSIRSRNIRNPNLAYFADARKFLEEKFGKENILLQSNHFDETTSHASFLVFPSYKSKKTGKICLSTKHFTGGSKYELSLWQSEFHEKVAEAHNLTRGVKNSAVRNMSIQEYKKKVIAGQKALENPPKMTDFLKNAKASYEKLDSMLNAAIDLKIRNDIYEKERVKLASSLTKLQQADSERNYYEQQAKDRYEDVKELEEKLKMTLEDKKILTKYLAETIKKKLAKTELAKLFNVEIAGKQDIFDVLIKSKEPDFVHITKFSEAVDFVYEKFSIEEQKDIKSTADFTAGLDGFKI